jgi:hypothetical protein
MARITFFSTPEPRQYNYTPRYYDERKERLEELYKKYGRTPEGMRKAEAEASLQDAATGSADHYVPGSLIHGAYARARRNQEEPRAKTRSRMKKILTVVSVLLIALLAWFLGKGFLQMMR